jgi:acetylornithine aminotransferase
MKLFDVYPLFDIEPTSGRGATIFDSEGTQYLDFYGGHAVISIGHTHPHYVRAIESQLHRLSFYSNSVQNKLQMDLADKLGRLSGCQDYAIENALKLASFHTGKMRILAFKGAFHGRTSAAVNITDNPKIKAPINATFPVDFIPMNDAKTLEKELKKGDVAAVIAECLQGVGGVNVQTVPFLKKIRSLCSTHKAVMIADEIQSGYGRSGKFFAFQHADIVPDLITILYQI